MVNKTAKQPVNYQLSLVASAFMQEMSLKTSLKHDMLTGSEEDLTNKVKHAKESQGSTEPTRFET